MERTEYICTRIGIALLSYFCGFFIMAIYPVEASIELSEHMEPVATVAFVVSTLQLLGIFAAWINVRHRRVIGAVLSLSAVSVLVTYGILWNQPCAY